MDRINRMKRLRMRGLSNNTLFNMFDDYLKETVARDLERMYKMKARLLEGEPWVFHLDNK